MWFNAFTLIFSPKDIYKILLTFNSIHSLQKAHSGSLLNIESHCLVKKKSYMTFPIYTIRYLIEKNVLQRKLHIKKLHIAYLFSLRFLLFLPIQLTFIHKTLWYQSEILLLPTELSFQKRIINKCIIGIRSRIKWSIKPNIRIMQLKWK